MSRQEIKVGDTIEWKRWTDHTWGRGTVLETNGHCMKVAWNYNGRIMSFCSSAMEVRVLTALDLIADV